MAAARCAELAQQAPLLLTGLAETGSPGPLAEVRQAVVRLSALCSASGAPDARAMLEGALGGKPAGARR